MGKCCGKEPKIPRQDIKSENNKESKSEIFSARETVRFNANFEPDIDIMDKEQAYYQFLVINDYYERKTINLFPEGFFSWKDPNLAAKLKSEIKKFNDNAERMNGFVISKAMDDYHPETMSMYIELLKHEDYIWQLLNRQLLIYNKFYTIVDDKTIEYIEYLKKEEDKKRDIIEPENI